MNLEQLTFRRWFGQEIPLANQFYKRTDKRLKARPDDVVWTATWQEHTVAALRLRPLPSGEHLLTGVLVDPDYRCRGIARALITQAKIDFSRHYTYLFCEPQLAPLYRAVGFEQTEKSQMPDTLVGRWQAYQRKTPELIAMQYQ